MDAKYYAGLFDADGSFGIQSNKLASGNYKIYPRCSIKQVSFRDQPLRTLHEDFGGTFYTEDHKGKNWNQVSGLVFTANTGLRFMQQVKNHLVLKREVVDFILSISGQEVQKELLKVYKKILKEIRYEIHPLKKNHPSRRWMAGYIDGDGCLRSQLKGDGLVTTLEITSYSRDTQGLELLKKAFGGSIHKSGPNAIRWVKHLNETNASKVLGYFSNHSKIKRVQVLFCLNYLNKGLHLKKRGATLESNMELKEQLQALKQPQRLSEKGSTE